MSVPYAIAENWLRNRASASLLVVALRRAREHEEVEPLALDRREHLERDDEHDVAVARQPAQRRALRLGLRVFDHRELRRVPAAGRLDEGQEQTRPRPPRRRARSRSCPSTARSSGPARPPATNPSAKPATTRA